MAQLALDPALSTSQHPSPHYGKRAPGGSELFLPGKGLTLRQGNRGGPRSGLSPHGRSGEVRGWA